MPAPLRDLTPAGVMPVAAGAAEAIALVLAMIAVVVALTFVGNRIARVLSDAIGRRLPQSASESDGIGVNWAAVVSFRVWGSSGCLAVLVGAFGATIFAALGFEGDVSATILAILIGVVFLFTLIAQIADPANVLYCPHCRKRVKRGARVCHHCGRAVI